MLPGGEPSAEGTVVWPSLNGATIWFSPSYSPLTKLYYVAAREKSSKYFKSEAEYKPGNPISFNIEGKQHIAIAAGHTLYVFGLN